jgi:sulfonate dioxygenase
LEGILFGVRGKFYHHKGIHKRVQYRFFSRYALYSSFSPGFQKYLEGLTAVHSAVAQADGARAAGLHVRREPIESIHPVVRVHPVTGWKSIYVNPG